jgi:hypothetical protein
MITLLIWLNLFWSLCAWIYDGPTLLSIPSLALPFVVICPLFPLLLAGVWLGKKTEKNNIYLQYLAILPSCIYGLLALFFYPLLLHFDHFSWSALLEIPWVLFYGIQGWYLLPSLPRHLPALTLTSVFLLVSFFIQFSYKSFGYLAIDLLPLPYQILLLCLACISLLGVGAYVSRQAKA